MADVTSILNPILEAARSKAEAAEDAAQRAMALSRKLVARRINGSVEITGFPEALDIDRGVPDLDLGEGRKQSMVGDVTRRLNAIFTSFFSTYMPLGRSFDVADEWAARALEGNGSGLDSVLEERIWELDRGRILRDKWRQETEVRAQWAARRYPMPPGAMDFQLMQLNRDLNNKVADSSRERAIITFQAEIENMRVALGRAIEMRTAAIDRAISMFNTNMQIDQMGVQYQTAFEQQRVALINALSALYSTETSGWSARKGIERGNIDLKQQDEARVHDADKFSLEKEVDAAMQAAQAAGTQAAAALNGLHAQGSISYSESKDRTGE